MEPLIRTVTCPNCGEHTVHFANAPEAECESCNFHAAYYADPVLAAQHLLAYRQDPDVIVADPLPMGGNRFVLAHTRLFLV